MLIEIGPKGRLGKLFDCMKATTPQECQQHPRASQSSIVHEKRKELRKKWNCYSVSMVYAEKSQENCGGHNIEVRSYNTFFIWFLPRESIFSFAMPLRGIIRSIELVDSASRLVANENLSMKHHLLSHS